MNHSRHSYITLSEEIEVLQLYLDMERLRFKDAFDYSIILDDVIDSDEIRIPPLLVQPLVENAIKHGIEKRSQGGAVRIAASSSNRRLELTIYNEGPRLENLAAGQAQRPEGIGLSNLRRRLTLLYGGDFNLSLNNHDAAGVQASVSLPYREGG